MKSAFTIAIFNLLILQSFSSRIIFPGITLFNYHPEDNVTPSYDRNSGIEESPKENKANNIIEIPESILSQLGDYSNLNDLQKELGIVIAKEPDLIYSSRNAKFSVRSQQRGMSKNSRKAKFSVRSQQTDHFISNPEQAHCEPELRVVALGLQNTNEITYYPTCVRIKQCGGCCPQKRLLACQATASKKVVVKVLELSHNNAPNEVSARMTSNRRNKRVQGEYKNLNVTVEEHTQCDCMCQIRESACDLSIHNYDEGKCECICRQKDKEEKCYNKKTHIWNSQSCKCLCRHVLDCSSGNAFDHATCSCKPTVILSWDEYFLRSTKPKESPFNRRKPVAVPIN